MLPLFTKVNATGAFQTIVYNYFYWKGKFNLPIAPGCKILVLSMAWVTCFSQEKAFQFNMCHKFDLLHPSHPSKPLFWCMWISVHTKTTMLLKIYYSKNKDITRTLQPALFFKSLCVYSFQKSNFFIHCIFFFLGKHFTYWYTFMHQPLFYLTLVIQNVYFVSPLDECIFTTAELTKLQGPKKFKDSICFLNF